MLSVSCMELGLCLVTSSLIIMLVSGTLCSFRLVKLKPCSTIRSVMVTRVLKKSVLYLTAAVPKVNSSGQVHLLHSLLPCANFFKYLKDMY